MLKLNRENQHHNVLRIIKRNTRSGKEIGWFCGKYRVKGQ